MWYRHGFSYTRGLMMNDTNNSYPGFADVAQGTDLDATLFLIKQQVNRLRTAQVVKVIKVYPGGTSQTNSSMYLPTTVDVQPVIDSVDADGNRTAHGTIYGIQVARHHFGGNAVLVDPVIGDVGVIHCADRDISSVVANQGSQSAPGSGRRHDFSDAIYTGGLWTQNPTNYLDLRNQKISLATPNNMSLYITGNEVETVGTWTITDKAGSIIEIDGSGNVYIYAAAGKVYLGAKPGEEGNCYPVNTTGGYSTVVYAHL